MVDIWKCKNILSSRKINITNFNITDFHRGRGGGQMWFGRVPDINGFYLEGVPKVKGEKT